MADEFEDLDTTLSAAFDAFEAGEGQSAPGTSSQPAPGVSGEPAQATPQQSGETAAQAAQRARDEQGRFAKQPDAGQPATQKTETTTPQGAPGAAAPPPSTPPATWSATAKAKFATLDPEIQREVLKREGEMDQGRAQWQQGAERLNRLDAILAPRREQFALAGLDDVRAVQTLFAAQDYLNRDPAGALIYLGRQSGVNWQALFQRLQGAPQQPGQQPGQPQTASDPGLARQVQALTQSFQQQQEQQRSAAQQQLSAQIQQFSSDPKNLYFENVKHRMGDLIRAGLAKDLPDAYEQACLSDPAVRPLMLAQLATHQQDAAKAAATQRVAEARRASGSITGSPSPGASPNGTGQPRSLDDELSAAWDAASV